MRLWVIVGTAKVRTWEGKKTRCIREDAGTWIYLCISEAGHWIGMQVVRVAPKGSLGEEKGTYKAWLVRAWCQEHVGLGS